MHTMNKLSILRHLHKKTICNFNEKIFNLFYQLGSVMCHKYYLNATDLFGLFLILQILKCKMAFKSIFNEQSLLVTLLGRVFVSFSGKAVLDAWKEQCS